MLVHPNFDPVAIALGPIAIRWYGLMYLVAFAVSYGLGRLEIRRLRTLAEQQLGPRFDIKAFHDRVLANGAVPLPVLSAEIERWIGTSR